MTDNDRDDDKDDEMFKPRKDNDVPAHRMTSTPEPERKKVHRIPGTDGHTFVIHGTREQADAYVRMYTDPAPDTCEED